MVGGGCASSCEARVRDFFVLATCYAGSMAWFCQEQTYLPIKPRDERIGVFMKASGVVIAAAMSVSCQAAEVPTPKPKCIGYASVDARNNIELNLLSTEATHGGAMLLIDKAHPQYKQIRRHVGRLRIREWKCVKPWEDKTTSDRNVQITSSKPVTSVRAPKR